MIVRRLDLLCMVLAAGALAAGCGKGKAPKEEKEMTIVLEGDTARLREKEAQISRQRAELAVERERLIDERKGVLDQLKGGTGVDELVQLQRQLLDRERRLQAREDTLAKQQQAVGAEKDRLLQGVSAKAPPKDGAGDVHSREVALAGREQDLAHREKAVAEREARVAEREAALAAQVSAAVAAPEPGRTVSRAEVEQAHRRVRTAMLKRGILPSDLPPDVAALERRIYRSSKKGRWLEAYDAVRDLGTAVDALHVGDAFIQAKMHRLAALQKKAHLDQARAAQVQSLLGEATRAFTDGRYDEANVSLNRIFGVLSK